MKGSRSIQGKGFSFVVAVSMASLLVVAPETAYGGDPVKGVLDGDKTAAYFVAHPGPFCAFEGVWYDWEHDETIKLGCLELKGNIREGSYSSARGPRAKWNYSVSGTYDIDPDSSMQVIGKDRQGFDVNFTTMIYVEDKEYPTPMIVVDEEEERVYIWKGKE